MNLPLYSSIQMNYPFPMLSLSHLNKLTGLESLAPFPWKSLKCQRAPIASLSVAPCSGQYLLCSSPEAASLSLYDLYQRVEDHRPMSPAKIKKNVTSITTDESAHAIAVVKWWPVDTGLFTTLSRHRLHVWDTNRFQTDYEFKLNVPAYCQEYSSLAKHHLFVAVGTHDGIRLCDLRSGSQAQVLREAGCDNRVSCLVWSPYQEHCIISGGHSSFYSTTSSDGIKSGREREKGKDKSLLKVWDIRRQGSLSTFDGTKKSNPTPIASLAFSRDHRSLLTMDEKGALQLWDSHSKRQIPFATGEEKIVQWRQSLPTSSVTALKHGYFAVPHLNRIQLLEYGAAATSLVEKKELVEHWDQVIALDYNYHLEELVSAGMDNQIIVWGLGK